jgi:hypothetical protein
MRDSSIFQTTIPVTKGVPVVFNILPKTKVNWAKVTQSGLYFTPLSFTKTLPSRIVVQPGSDYSLTEQPVMVIDEVTKLPRQMQDYDGRPIFTRTFTGSLPSTPLVEGWNQFNIALGIKRILHHEFNITSDGLDRNCSGGVLISNGTVVVTEVAGVSAGGGLYLGIVMNVGGSSGSLTILQNRLLDCPYVLTVEYTKV